MAIKKYKDERTRSFKSGSKRSVYEASPKEKTPHGGVVKGVRRSKRTIGKRQKPDTQKSMHQKEDLREAKAENKKRVRTYTKHETEYRGLSFRKGDSKSTKAGK